MASVAARAKIGVRNSTNSVMLLYIGFFLLLELMRVVDRRYNFEAVSSEIAIAASFVSLLLAVKFTWDSRVSYYKRAVNFCRKQNIILIVGMDAIRLAIFLGAGGFALYYFPSSMELYRQFDGPQLFAGEGIRNLVGCQAGFFLAVVIAAILLCDIVFFLRRSKRKSRIKSVSAS